MSVYLQYLQVTEGFMTSALSTKSVCREKMLAISVRPLASLGHFTAAIFAPSKGPKLLSSQLFSKAVLLSNGSNEVKE